MCTLSVSLSCSEVRRRTLPISQATSPRETPLSQPHAGRLTEEQIVLRSNILTCCCVAQVINCTLWATHLANTAQQHHRQF